jgi:hypothetical protein
VLLVSAAAAGAERVGEFSIPSVSPLTPAQLEKLRALVATDPEAKALAEQAKARALPLLDAEPHPLEVIHYEGRVNTDPLRIATVEKLREMGDVARLVRYWQVSGDSRAAATLRRFILAWTGTYRLTGNDVNENKFRPLLVAYHALRDDFPAGERAKVDAWVERLGKLHKWSVERSTHFTNRYSKHVRLLALAGMILGRDEWVAAAHEGVKRFVRNSLYADGTSRDLKRRDTLTYHMSALKPPIELAMLAGDKGRELYTWRSPAGGSLKRSVDYVVPYAMGDKTRREWTHSTVDLDRRRAEAGLEHYRPGKLFEPRQALDLMELAGYFDQELMRVVHHLTDSDAERFPTWQTLINEAARPSPRTQPMTRPEGG